jgi:enamine deaminase RidA (YjgF/YER057c/UK114 family)
MRQAYANVQEVLAKYGATMDNIVDEAWLVTDIQSLMAQLEPLFTARVEAYGGNPDVTQTAVQVAGLVMPELLIEIKCIAHL